MAKIEQEAFAAINVDSPGKKHICAWTVSGSAKGVRDAVGRGWCKENPAAGWKAARLDGMRVFKITMTVIQ